MNIYDFKLEILFLFLISFLWSFISATTHGVTEDALEEQESEEFENSLVGNVRNDYRNGFVELLNFINSINNTLTAMNTRLAFQDTKFENLNDKIDDLKGGFDNLNARVVAQDKELATLKENSDAQKDRMIAQDAKLHRLSQNTNLLLKKAWPNLNTWERFDALIRTQDREINTGKSFNGSTLSDIKSRATQFGYSGWHTVIVFVNHLDEAIDDFTIYDEYNNNMYNPAPNSVPGRTQEVFTFAHPTNRHSEGWASFSYVIPSLNIRLAAITQGAGRSAGLAFVPKGTDMKTYYDSHKGIEGSSVWETGDQVDRNLSVGYKNFYARMFVDNYGHYQATLRIELIKFSLDD